MTKKNNLKTFGIILLIIIAGYFIINSLTVVQTRGNSLIPGKENAITIDEGENSDLMILSGDLQGNYYKENACVPCSICYQPDGGQYCCGSFTSTCQNAGYRDVDPFTQYCPGNNINCYRDGTSVPSNVNIEIRDIYRDNSTKSVYSCSGNCQQTKIQTINFNDSINKICEKKFAIHYVCRYGVTEDPLYGFCNTEQAYHCEIPISIVGGQLNNLAINYKDGSPDFKLCFAEFTLCGEWFNYNETSERRECKDRNLCFPNRIIEEFREIPLTPCLSDFTPSIDLSNCQSNGYSICNGTHQYIDCSDKNKCLGSTGVQRFLRECSLPIQFNQTAVFCQEGQIYDEKTKACINVKLSGKGFLEGLKANSNILIAVVIILFAFGVSYVLKKKKK